MSSSSIQRARRVALLVIASVSISPVCLAAGGRGLADRATAMAGRSGPASQPDAPVQFALKDGDRVVFYGDSITEQRLYTTYVEHYCTTRYPDRRITFINTGWGGDKVTANDCQPCAGVGGLARIKRDLLDYRPTVVTLLFGMNDGQYQVFDPAVMKVYEDGLRAIITEIKSKTQARIYVMTPTVYDGTRHTPWSRNDKYNEVLDRYSEVAKQIAAADGLPIIDLHAFTTDALARAKQQNASYTFLPDGVHPAEDGQLLMAAEILRAWGAPAKGYEFTATERKSLPLTLTVAAPLPWPRPAPSQALASVAPQITKAGNVSVRLPGLARGRYSVTVDGKDAGQFTDEALALGLSVGELSTSAMEESEKLAGAIRQRADLFFFRWRQLELPYGKEYSSARPAASAIDALIDEMRDRGRTLGALHRYEISINPVR